MTETAALLVDEILPQQPIRQWVLSLPKVPYTHYPLGRVRILDPHAIIVIRDNRVFEKVVIDITFSAWKRIEDQVGADAPVIPQIMVIAQVIAQLEIALCCRAAADVDG
jgi:hypothetical protein